jgi:hypothetical protein
MPNGSLTNQYTCLVAFSGVAIPATCPEICRSLNNSPSSASPSDSHRAFSLGGHWLSQRLAQSFVDRWIILPAVRAALVRVTRRLPLRERFGLSPELSSSESAVRRSFARCASVFFIFSEDEAAVAKLNRLDLSGVPLVCAFLMDFLDLPSDTVVVMVLSRGQSLVSRILRAGACFLFRLGRIVWLLNAVYIPRCVDSSATISPQSLAEALDDSTDRCITTSRPTCRVPPVRCATTLQMWFMYLGLFL